MEEIAAEAGVAQELVAWVVSIGIVKPERPGTLRFGDVFRVKLVSALLDAGVSKSLMERAAVLRWLNLDHVDAYLPREPTPPRIARSPTLCPPPDRSLPSCPSCTKSWGCLSPIRRCRSTSTRRRCSDGFSRDGTA